MNSLLSVLPQVEVLSPRLVRILGCNPGHMTLQGTNTYLVGTGSKRLLVDAGERNNSAYITSLTRVLKEQRATLAHVIITHWHHDHIGGLCDVLTATNKEAVVHKFPCQSPPDAPLPDWVQLKALQHNQQISVDGATLRVMHTPGHSSDHVALQFVDGDQGVLTADCVLGEGTTVFEDLYEYMNSLNELLSVTKGPLYPGHGPVINDGASKIRQYIEHRTAREDQIYKTLTTMPATMSRDLVRAVYTEISEQLIPAAENNLRLHLAKLVREGKVQETDGRYSATSIPSKV